jgi:hypothetical protein
MKRYLALAPATFDLEALKVDAKDLWPNLRDVNIVDGMIAVYLDDEADSSDLSAWGAVVAAHVPSPPPVEPLLALAHAIVDATTLDDIKAAASQILADAGVNL